MAPWKSRGGAIVVAMTGGSMLLAVALALAAACTSAAGPMGANDAGVSDAATDARDASDDVTYCGYWPSGAAEAVAASEGGCRLSAHGYGSCSVTSGSVITPDGAVYSPDGAIVVPDCQDYCLPTEYAIYCGLHRSVDLDAALGCHAPPAYLTPPPGGGPICCPCAP